MWILLFVHMAVAAPSQSLKCFTENDVKANVCRALCRTDGYDTGTYVPHTKECGCTHFKKFHEITEQRLIVRSPPPQLPDAPPAPVPKGFQFRFTPDEE